MRAVSSITSTVTTHFFPPSSSTCPA
jgi:hypothetical protein